MLNDSSWMLEGVERKCSNNRSSRRDNFPKDKTKQIFIILLVYKRERKN